MGARWCFPLSTMPNAAHTGHGGWRCTPLRWSFHGWLVPWASSPVQVSLVIEEAQHIPPPATPARRAALEARLDVVQTQITPAAAAAIRGEWESRPASARRAGYLAAAAFMDAAILFDVERGAV